MADTNARRCWWVDWGWIGGGWRVDAEVEQQQEERTVNDETMCEDLTKYLLLA